MKKAWSLLLLCIVACSVSGKELLPMHTGEVFIDSGNFHFQQWKVKAASGSKVGTNRYFLFLSSDKDDVAGKCQAELDMKNQNCSGFDRFILLLAYSGKKSCVQLFVDTDDGVKKSKKRMLASKFYKFIDLSVDIGNAKVIKKLTIKFEQKEKGRRRSTLSSVAMILRNSTEFAAYARHWERFSKLKWHDMLKDESYNPQYKLTYGLLFNQKDLNDYRKKYGKYFFERNKDWQENKPPVETLIHENIINRRGCREYIQEKYEKSMKAPSILFNRAKIIAFSGLVTKNKKMLRYAARTALSYASMGAWSDTPFLNLQGGIGSAFEASHASYTLALLLDMAGEMLTEKGKKYVLKAMMFKGIAETQFSCWNRPYIFKMNQGIAFLKGQLAALLIFNKIYPRVMPMLRYTKAGIDESVNHCFSPNGDYLESTAYMYCVVKLMAQVCPMYANMMNKPLKAIIPENVQKSGAFAEVIASTSKNPEIIVHSIGVCYSWGYMGLQSAAFMAMAVPDSMWVNLYKKIQNKGILQKLFPDRGMTAFVLSSAANKAKKVKPKSFVLLKDAGIASSLRSSNDELTKLVVIGDSSPGMGKKHNDVGSFILEFAGDIYGMDMAVYTGLFAEAQYHNMLVPVDQKGEFVNSFYFSKIKDRGPMCPVASGNDKTLKAQVDASNSWRKNYFKKHVRSIDSSNPAEMTIHDEYTLGCNATGVAFIWNTYLPCKVNNNKITITGKYGSKCIITTPENCKIELDRFSPGKKILRGMFLPPTHKCTRIIIRKKSKSGEKGTLTVKVKLIKPTETSKE